MTTSNDELDALRRINDILAPLSQEEQMRCLGWLTSRYGQELNIPIMQKNDAMHILPEYTDTSVPPNSGQDVDYGSPQTSYMTVADILTASTAHTESQRFLMAAYWHVNSDRNITFKSREINSLLNDAGYRIKTVGNVIRDLKGAKPALIIQCGKNTTSKAKTSKGCDIIFKLTEQGMKESERMLAHE